MGVFHGFKMYRWYQIAQNIKYSVTNRYLGKCEELEIVKIRKNNQKGNILSSR